MTFLLAYWKYLAAAALAAIVYFYYVTCETTKRDHLTMVAALEARAQAAEEAARKQAAEDRKRKEIADAENKRLLARNADLARQLRDHRNRDGYLPPAAPTAKRPDRIAFDRAELDAAIRRLDEGVSGLIAEGDAARIGLDTARAWSNSALRPRQPE